MARRRIAWVVTFLLMAACGEDDDPAGAPTSSPVELARPPATSIAPSSPSWVPADTGVPEPEGPQPQTGDGWRLLGDEFVGEPYRTGIATTDGQYHQLWRQAGMTAQRPPVDFENEVVVWFGAAYSAGCAIRLDDLEIATDSQPVLVHAVTVVPGRTGVCRSDANPHAFVVAIDRERLPAGPFAIQLGAADPSVGVSEERTLVEADLTGPGAVFVEPGFPSPYRMYVYCGIAVLGELNGVWWMTGTNGVRLPRAWQSLVDPNAHTLVVDVLVTPGPGPTVTATANGHSVVYEPVAAEAVPSCD